MALFNKVSKAAISPPPAKAAAAGGGYTRGNEGAKQVGAFYSYQSGFLRDRCMQVPTISRARDLFASVIGSMPLEMYTEMWNGEEMEEVPLAPRAWLKQLDPEMPNNYLFSWLLDDLLFFGRSFLYITARTADGYMAQATRIPAASVNTTDMAGPVWFGKSKEIYFEGGQLDPKNVVQFVSGSQGIIYSSEMAIDTALKVEAARNRNAASAIPAGVLVQTGGEPLSGTELQEIAAAFNAARATNQTAALNEFLRYEPSNATPDKMLMIESSNYSALEASRLCNVPPYLVGVSTGAYSYQSSQQARADLWIFGVKPFAECIASTLSQQLPRGTYCRFDADDYLKENYAADSMPDTAKVEEMPQENTQEELA